MDVKLDVKSPPRKENNSRGNDRRHGGRRYNRNRHQHNNATGQQGGKFQGKIKEIADDTFGNTGTNNAAQFNKSLKNIANYLQLTLRNDASEAVRNMAPITITIPPPCSPPLTRRIQQKRCQSPRSTYIYGNRNTPRPRRRRTITTTTLLRRTL
jgi:hypothetical protein